MSSSTIFCKKFRFYLKTFSALSLARSLAPVVPSLSPHLPCLMQAIIAQNGSGPFLVPFTMIRQKNNSCKAQQPHRPYRLFPLLFILISFHVTSAQLVTRRLCVFDSFCCWFWLETEDHNVGDDCLLKPAVFLMIA